MSAKINDKEYLDAELNLGIGFHNENFIKLARNTAATLKLLPKCKTVIDFGCGTGVYARAYMEAGFDVTAVEQYPAYRFYIAENAPELKVVSLDEFMASGPHKVDVLSLIQVAEYMKDKDIELLFRLIQPKYILFSSNSDYNPHNIWQPINSKFQTDWVNIMKSQGFKLIAAPSYPTEWTKLFVHQKYYSSYR